MVQPNLLFLILTTLVIAVHSEPTNVLISITPSSPTTSFTVFLNQVVDIQLETCFECGNEWMLQSSPKANLFKAQEKGVIVPEAGLGSQRYTFTAQGKGKATLTFIYRPMGTKGSADAIARVIVHVNLVDPQTRKLQSPTPTRVLTTAQITVPARSPSPTPAPAPPQIVLTSSSPSSSIKASVSETLAIAFESCGTCGYQWVQLDSTPAFLVPLSGLTGVYTAPILPAGYTGGSGQQLFSYSPLAPGTAAVTFAYGRPWTPGVYDAQVIVSIAVTP